MATIHELAALLASGGAPSKSHDDIYSEVTLDRGMAWTMDDLFERSVALVRHPIYAGGHKFDSESSEDEGKDPHWMLPAGSMFRLRLRERLIPLHWRGSDSEKADTTAPAPGKLRFGREWAGTAEVCDPCVPEWTDPDYIGFIHTHPPFEGAHDLCFSVADLQLLLRCPEIRLMMIQSATHRYLVCRTKTTLHVVPQEVQQSWKRALPILEQHHGAGNWDRYAKNARQLALSTCRGLQMALYESPRLPTCAGQPCEALTLLRKV